jgi:hypothetical protein
MHLSSSGRVPKRANWFSAAGADTSGKVERIEAYAGVETLWWPWSEQVMR